MPATDSNHHHNPAISLRGISKKYEIWDQPSARLLTPLRQLLPGRYRKPAPNVFTAVHELSLDVLPGECVGIIGRNGAGKSTLLEMIAGTLQPSSGSIAVQGRVAALLELGSGFNPEFTGRENVYLNASILGMTRDEIDSRFEQIVEYSGIRDFIERPVRTYSSGMCVRLAFAVCAHVDADIIIIDEALAVGDDRFKFKCFSTLNHYLTEGKTVIFVSHDTNSVKRLCSSAILLEKGEVLLRGNPNEVVNIYTKLIAAPNGRAAIEQDLKEARSNAERKRFDSSSPKQSSDDPVADNASKLIIDERSHQQISDKEYSYGGEGGKIVSVTMTDSEGEPKLCFTSGDSTIVQVVCEAHSDSADPIYAITIKDVRGQEIFGTNTFFRGDKTPPTQSGKQTHVNFRLKLNLMAGVYFISVGWVRLENGEVEVVQRRYDVIRFEMLALDQSFGIAYCENNVEVR